MPKEKILVVDDEEDILEMVRIKLFKEGYQVLSAVTGGEALRIARNELPDLILLDLLLPDIDGFEVARILKNNPKTRDISIVMLTAKGEEADIIAGLELGADDYITKPFSLKVLAVKIRAVFRSRKEEDKKESEVLSVHDIIIHPGKYEVLVNGNPVSLTNTEFDLFHYLARKPGWVFTRTQIIDAVHGDDYFVTDRCVDVQVYGLRKKLGLAGKFIETVRGVGYRFRE